MKKRTMGSAAVIASLLCFAPTAVSTTASAATIYSENFDTGSATGFTLTGLWHVTSNFSDSPRYALGYVQGETPFSSTADGNYDTGVANSGTALSPLIALPSSGINLTLDAVNLNEVDNETGVGSLDFDVLRIGVSTDGTSFASILASTNPADGGTFFTPHPLDGAYAPLALDLSAFAGQSVYLMFAFDTGDEKMNDFPGVRIDNIQVNAVPLPAALPLFASGFGGLGALGFWRKRKRAA